MCVKNFSVTKVTAHGYIDKATEKVQHVFDARYESKASGLIASLQRVYREALQAGEFKSAIEAIKAIASIQGMDKKVIETNNKTDITVKDAEDFKNLSTKDLIKIVHNS
jgi:predicted metallopeptidase